MKNSKKNATKLPRIGIQWAMVMASKCYIIVLSQKKNIYVLCGINDILLLHAMLFLVSFNFNADSNKTLLSI